MLRWGSRNHTTAGNDSEDRDQKVQELRTAIGPISGRSLKYCTDACLRRYLVARNWHVDKARKMLEDTLRWRSAYKPEEIRWHEVAGEGKTGKIYRSGFQDRQGRVVIFLRPGVENGDSHDGQIRYMVYLIENAILNMSSGQEQMVWLIDFTVWSMGRAVPMKTAREAVNILQNHYAERLYAAFLYHPPRIFGTFWKILKYFLDPKTFDKVKFVYPKHEESMELMRKHFDLEMLPLEFGGKRKVTYNHEEFSKLMAKDDIRMSEVWGLEDKNSRPSIDHSASGGFSKVNP
ncbi:unnamed protein product [Spirodela intermedia]|uniref:CRAL-TRIO domain-containing protein n=1 Tax=Spirodela intermedia TaxID=51605 RepID=A0A7I8KQR0_SPIIN|nr:unnamed protein product [Spirodela intermedia]